MYSTFKKSLKICELNIISPEALSSLVEVFLQGADSDYCRLNGNARKLLREERFAGALREATENSRIIRCGGNGGRKRYR